MIVYLFFSLPCTVACCCGRGAYATVIEENNAADRCTILLCLLLQILGPHDMVPASLRQSSLQSCCGGGMMDEQMNVQTLEEAWLSDDEFVLDPTRITLYTG